MKKAAKGRCEMRRWADGLSGKAVLRRCDGPAEIMMRRERTRTVRRGYISYIRGLSRGLASGEAEVWVAGQDGRLCVKVWSGKESTIEQRRDRPERKT